MSMIDESAAKLKYPTIEMWSVVVGHREMKTPALTKNEAWENAGVKPLIDNVEYYQNLGWQCVRVIVSVKQE
jgi:hypothetical protein